MNGDEVVQARADGRYGEVDIFQWPQLFCPEYPWSVAITRNIAWPSCSAMPWAWYDPTYKDFERLPGSTLVVGFLKKDKREGLRNLNNELKKRFAQYKRGNRLERPGDQGLKLMQHVRSALNHIDRFPLSWRDIVACVAEYQRGVLECLAYFDYYEIIVPRCDKPVFPFPEVNQFWMGAFTDNHHTAEMLYRAGVPVWYLRSDDTITDATIIKDVVVTSPPNDIVRTMYSDPVTGAAKPFLICYAGSVSVSRQAACRSYYKQEDMEAFYVFVETREPQANKTGPPNGAQSSSPSSSHSNCARESQGRAKERAKAARPCKQSRPLDISHQQLTIFTMQIRHEVLEGKPTRIATSGSIWITLSYPRGISLGLRPLQPARHLAGTS